MSFLNIHVAEPVDSAPLSANPLFRAAFRLGLVTAIIIAAINTSIWMATAGTALEWPHMLLFLVLFACISYGMQSQRSWITEETEAQDRVLFGMIASGTAALGLMAINGILALVSYRLIVSETFLPIDDLLRFAMSSLALFFGCIVFGLISSIVMNFHYTKGKKVMPKDQSGIDDPLQRKHQLG